MFKSFNADLRLIRKRSGLTQADCGHLIGGKLHQISMIERGRRAPTIEEICALSILYGRSFEDLYAEAFEKTRRNIAVHLETLPEAPRDWPRGHIRSRTLERLAERLAEESNLTDGG
ncbi:helix-turn-helix transcriptional regulator [Pseudoruegeria sp. HB172150]|uniref:helix-turn-helix transcriptional regulator n=1 Tax=Pseudoruegeria sp. HB172150 TaxID=2721164 RepID=UPI0015525086|nr:helix-turn-helix transcriptional regulator [Pseudoruegeria sp. HB172150]